MRKLFLLGLVAGAVLLFPLAGQAGNSGYEDRMDTSTHMYQPVTNCDWHWYYMGRGMDVCCPSAYCGPCGRHWCWGHRCHQGPCCGARCGEMVTVDHHVAWTCAGELTHPCNWNYYQSPDWDQYWNGWTDSWKTSWTGYNWILREREWYVTGSMRHLKEVMCDLEYDKIGEDLYVSAGHVTYPVTLGPGKYAVVASSGPRISEFGVSIEGPCDVLEAEDAGTDAVPALWFCVPCRTDLEINVDVSSWNGQNQSDYLGVLLFKD